MAEHFITSIQVNQSRNVKDLAIPLSEDKRKHLIVTGKNGSGKTSLLLEINQFLTQIVSGQLLSSQRGKNELSIKSYSRGIELYFAINSTRILKKYQNGEFLLAYFDAKRDTNLLIPSGIKKVEFKDTYQPTEKVSVNFLQYIVNLKADRSFARDDNETETVKQIDAWFERFEHRLKDIFDDPDLTLEFDRKAYNFNIISGDQEPFTFNHLSDGYASIISIVSELLLRMEARNANLYDLEGIVLIDEIETHLHVELQKKILPFLTDFFPKIQFIVTTHSPFILSSISEATICNLETRTVTSDLSSYSYDALIESYFKTDKYSEEIKTKIREYDRLSSLEDRSAEENDKLRQLRSYFAHAPKYLAPELLVKLQQIELQALNRQS